MPIDYRQYPPNWLTEIRPRVLARAQNRCECDGECGLHPYWRCQEFHGRKARFARGRIVLTIAHMNRGRFARFHEKENIHATLKAMCQKCHFRYDHAHHIEKAAETRKLKAMIWRQAMEEAGQENMFGGAE